MQNHHFDLQAGESIRLGSYTIKLVEIEGDGVVLEIDGPDGQVEVELIDAEDSRVEQEAVLV